MSTHSNDQDELLSMCILLAEQRAFNQDMWFFRNGKTHSTMSKEDIEKYIKSTKTRWMGTIWKHVSISFFSIEYTQKVEKMGNKIIVVESLDDLSKKNINISDLSEDCVIKISGDLIMSKMAITATRVLWKEQHQHHCGWTSGSEQQPQTVPLPESFQHHRRRHLLMHDTGLTSLPGFGSVKVGGMLDLDGNPNLTRFPRASAASLWAAVSI